jgi:hypothetical protein
MVLNSNHAANNSGIFLITEITMPFVILLLAIYVHRKPRGVWSLDSFLSLDVRESQSAGPALFVSERAGSFLCFPAVFSLDAKGAAPA